MITRTLFGFFLGSVIGLTVAATSSGPRTLLELAGIALVAGICIGLISALSPKIFRVIMRIADHLP